MSIEAKLLAESATLRVTLENPAHNLLRLADLTQLRDIFLEAGSPHSKARVITLTSKIPKVFSMGLDPSELLPLNEKQRALHFQMLAQMNVAALECGKPIICAVNGPAMAGGAVLASLADYRLFDSKLGKFCFSESKVNLPVPRFVQGLIHRTVNPNAIFEIAVMARNFDAAAALSCGFAHALYDSEEDLNSKIQDLVQKILRLDPFVVRATLVTANQSIIDETKQFKKGASAFDEFLGDDYFGKGLAAILGKGDVK